MKASSKAEELIAGADVVRKPARRPWAKLDRRAQPTKAFSLRMNDFEDVLLEAVASAQPTKTSKHAVAKRLLVAALEAEAERLKL
jgi:hypothetical protein